MLVWIMLYPYAVKTKMNISTTAFSSSSTQGQKIYTMSSVSHIPEFRPHPHTLRSRLGCYNHSLVRRTMHCCQLHMVQTVKVWAMATITTSLSNESLLKVLILIFSMLASEAELQTILICCQQNWEVWWTGFTKQNGTLKKKKERDSSNLSKRTEDMYL